MAPRTSFPIPSSPPTALEILRGRPPGTGRILPEARPLAAQTSCRLADQGTYSGSKISAPPKLAPLGNYGGLTQTMPPLAGSPAIDAGSDAATGTFNSDQRGFRRLSGAHVDIGAVEIQQAVSTTLAATLITTNSAVMNGTVTANDLTNTVYFEYAPCCRRLPSSKPAGDGVSESNAHERAGGPHRPGRRRDGPLSNCGERRVSLKLGGDVAFTTMGTPAS